MPRLLRPLPLVFVAARGQSLWGHAWAWASYPQAGHLAFCPLCPPARRLPLLTDPRKNLPPLTPSTMGIPPALPARWNPGSVLPVGQCWLVPSSVIEPRLPAPHGDLLGPRPESSAVSTSAGRGAAPGPGCQHLVGPCPNPRPRPRPSRSLVPGVLRPLAPWPRPPPNSVSGLGSLGFP